MGMHTVYCVNVSGAPKEKFASERSAKRACTRKRNFRNRRFPAVYHCPGCGGYHLTRGGA